MTINNGGQGDAEMSKRSAEELKGSVRMGSSNAKKYNKVTEANLKKQNVLIEKMKKDNELLKQQYENIMRTVNISQNKEIIMRIAQLNEEHDMLLRKIHIEREKIRKAHEDILPDIEDNIAKARADRGGIDVTKENQKIIDKQVAVLENRLDKALIKFNEVLAYNKKLRDSIENLRQERVVFDEIYKKMEKELHEKKRQMAEIIENSNMAYEERDEINHKLASLKVMQEEITAKYREEFKILDDMIKEDDAINDALKQKEKERKDMEYLGKTPDTEGPLRSQVQKGNAVLGIQKQKHLTNLNKVKEYEERFKKIEANTGFTIDELIKKFSAAEDQNFSLFNYVNELHSEIEKLELQISELENEIKKCKGEDAKSDSQRKKMLDDLDEQIRLTEEKTEQYENRFKNATKTVASLASGIQSTFNSIGCDMRAVSEILGTSEVTESNIMVYLGLIEQRTNELLQSYVKVAEKEVLSKSAESEIDATSTSSLIIGPQHPAGVTKINIVPPTTTEGDEGNEDEISDEDERPLTRNQLIEKSKLSVSSTSHHGKKKQKKLRTK